MWHGSRLRRGARTAVRGPLRRLARHEVLLAVRDSPALVAKVLPIDPSDSMLRVPLGQATTDQERSSDGLPLPPAHLHEVEDYVATGEQHFESLRAALADLEVGLDDLQAVLEFGSGSGRLTRHFLSVAERGEVWGVDINAESIAWCESHLRPIRFAACSTFPHLAFPDATFDLVYAGSVFTHISELPKMWLLELVRVARPGGLLYLTIHDQAYIEASRAKSGHWTQDMVREHADVLDRLGADLAMVSIERSSKDAMVYYDREALLDSWSDAADVVAVVDGAYGDQTAIVLRKR